MRRLGVLLLLPTLAFAVGACGGDTADDADAATAAACEPVGDGGGAAVRVVLDEWSITPAPAVVPAGKVTFDVRNEGEEPHELVIVRGVAAADLPVVDGKVDEEALPAGAFVGEVEAFPAGEACEGTFALGAGTYILFCNIVEQHEGRPESHVEEGMVTSFEVR